MKIKLSAALGENLPDTFLDVGSTPTVSTNKKARKGHFLLVEKGRKEATGINENVEISGFFNAFNNDNYSHLGAKKCHFLCNSATLSATVQVCLYKILHSCI